MNFYPTMKAMEVAATQWLEIHAPRRRQEAGTWLTPTPFTMVIAKSPRHPLLALALSAGVRMQGVSGISPTRKPHPAQATAEGCLLRGTYARMADNDSISEVR